ncbi:MAG: Dam family site-specific DNA-(adenine-N6)-methyltransferase [Chloroflexi bacterium]|nr:Dam family site-specific DNA-(adenine-N6)-methyltransferase [Chloroflexota bacterium]MBU1746754.1 Dam family site-specific DNA-(adenine-N6)-methyltransferase [Chloroflexota bacterium]
MDPLLPPLKWAGGKRWLVPLLRELWAPHAQRRLVEPFVGGLAVALGLQPRAALLNDINPHLVNFYRWLQQDWETAGDVVWSSDQATYYHHRCQFNELIAGDQAHTRLAAWLFYYLNRTGFNGLCRFNRQGRFNVPWGAGRYGPICYDRDWAAYQEALANWQFTCGDFGAVPVQPGDFIYADPPYDAAFTAYHVGGFTWFDQVRLARWLAAHAGPVVVSHAATDRVQQLYSELGFQVQLLPAPRRIAANGDRTQAVEILATRHLASARAWQQLDLWPLSSPVRFPFPGKTATAG